MVAKTLSMGLAAAVAVASPPALAGQGTLSKIPTNNWTTNVPEKELAEMRGGFNGLSFNVSFVGSVDNVGNVEGFMQVANGGATLAPPPDFGIEDGQVRIQTTIGDFQGASGIFQITQVPGSFNVVNNNLFVQIAVVNVLNNQPIPSLSTLFSGVSP